MSGHNDNLKDPWCVEYSQEDQMVTSCDSSLQSPCSKISERAFGPMATLSSFQGVMNCFDAIIKSNRIYLERPKMAWQM